MKSGRWRRRGRGWAAGTLLVLLATLMAQAAPSGATVEISGFGFGHGRGMGQWGAYGYATEYGWGYRQILAHYYGGTTLGALALPEPDVTVHLVELDGHNTIATAIGGGSLVAGWTGGVPLAAPAFEVVRNGLQQVVYSSSGCAGPWHQVAVTAQPVDIASAAGTAGGPVAAGIATSELQACIPGTGARTYQGELVSQPSGETDNIVGLEDYVDGVVPAESPATWATSGGTAALEAQAVAARSYAIAAMAASGAVCDVPACQVYAGWPDQYGPTVDAAVAATAGEVLFCDAGSKCGPAGSVALAEYSASTGGYTAGGTFPAVPDLGDAVAANPVHAWAISVPASRIESAFPSIGSFVSIQVTQRNGLGQIGGRVQEVSVTGTAGGVNLTGAQLAADLSLDSDWFTVGGAPLTVPPPGAGATTTTVPPAGATTTTEPPAAGGPTTTTAPPTGLSPTAASGTRADDGYWVADSEGNVAAFGTATFYGTAAGTTIQGKVTGMAATPDSKGYWLVGSNGGVLAFGDAHWYGSASNLHLAHRAIGMVPTPNGRGYWIVASDGGVFAFGNARFYGSVGNFHLGWRIAGMAATPDGRGYWLVGTQGGVLAFGDAHFYGSATKFHLVQPVTGIVPSRDGRGYFLVARDGGVFAFGDAAYAGSLPSERIKARVVAVAPAYDEPGYYVLTSSGKVYALGSAAPAEDLDLDGPAPSGRAVAIVAADPRRVKS